MGLATLALRLFHIRDRPIFNDEAIFLRWAQLIHDSPSRLFEITLEDPKPPLHPALLAIFIRIGHDPVLAGRVISAVVGMLTVFAFALVAYELEKRSDAAVIAAILAAGSPFFAFHQRLATADALFVLESLGAVWLTLCGSSLLAGTALGAALETRSLFSLSLGVMVFAKGRKRFVLTALAALCLWLPYLLASPGRYRPSLAGELRRRVFYQSQFHPAAPSLDAFGWLWTYLTPPVLIAAIVALVLKHHWFFALWTAAMLLPVIFGSVTYSRLPSMPPSRSFSRPCLSSVDAEAVPHVCGDCRVSAVLHHSRSRRLARGTPRRERPLSIQQKDGRLDSQRNRRSRGSNVAQPQNQLVQIETSDEWGLPADGLAAFRPRPARHDELHPLIERLRH